MAVTPGGFQRIALDGDAGLYAWQGEAPAGDWVGYLLMAGASAVTNLPADQAWNDHWGIPVQGQNGGIYLFTQAAPADDAAALALLQRLETYITGLNGPGPAYTAYRYFLWVANPADTAPIAAQGINFVQDSFSGQVLVEAACSLNFLNIQLQVGAKVGLVTSNNVTFSLQPLGTASLQFVNALGTQVEPFGQVLGGATFAIAGNTPGQLALQLQLSVYNLAQEDDLRRMRTGVQFFHTEGDGTLVGYLCPVLRQTDTPQVFMNVWLDPLYPLDGTRTRFTFTFAADGTPPPTFASCLLTDGGHAVSLTPFADDAGFVLQGEMYPVGFMPAPTPQTPTYYFTPTGRFTLAFDGPASSTVAPAQANLLCGLSGIETITVARPGQGYTGDVLRFHPDQPAYAPVFPLPAVDLRKPGSPAVSAQLLRGDYTTAWATIVRGQQIAPIVGDVPPPNAYYSQPGNAPLYKQPGTAGMTDAAGPTLLTFHAVKLADLGDDTPADAFPLVPYLGLDPSADTTTVAAFESQLLVPTRKEQLLAVKARARARGELAVPDDDAPIHVTTPQGLLAKVPQSGSGNWQSLQLATNQDGATAYTMVFDGLDTRLQDALQTNQQFMVMSQLPTGTTMTFDGQMGIEGWPFQVDIGKGSVPGDYRNVLIFKFLPGKLSDHMTNPSNWTGAADFNVTDAQGLPFLSQWLQDYIAQARQLAALEAQTTHQTYFQNFLDIVDSEAWTGILALRADITLGDFPPTLQGLLGGIDLSTFCAHHLGIEVNFVQPGDGGLQFTGNSSLFGLIYYIDAAYLAQLSLGADADQPVAAAPGTYDFKVLTLKVLFENTALKSFDSKLQITANQWFGDNVAQIVQPDGTAVTLRSNSILLDGAYQKHDGQDVFTFSSNTDRLFRLNSNVLGVVELVQAQFFTITDAGGPAGDQVQSRFVFAGYLNFMPPAEADPTKVFDVFSYGSDWANKVPGNGQGLYATNIAIDMSFPKATPSVRTFAFDAGKIAFNMDQSRTRAGSLVPAFPLKVSGLVSGAAGQTPTQLGYLSVSVADDALTGLSGAWNGLVFQLDLGTLGALAGSAGLGAQLMLAWSLGSGGTQNTYAVSVFVQLPGTGGDAKLLSLQGILKLAIDDLQLLRGQTSDGRPAFMLKLTQIALKFLGISFPPQGNTVFFLFGNPVADTAQDTLGWYAAYVKPQTTQLADLEVV